MRTRDPDLVSVRRGLRVGIAFPLLAFLGLVVLDDPAVALFGPIGAIAYLVFAAFDGTTSDRLRGNLALAAGGVLAIALGTIVEDSLVSAAFTIGMATFWLRWITCVGGRVGGIAPAMLLVLVVAMLTPGGPEQMGGRLLGWLAAAGLCTLLGTFLLPVRPHRAIRRTLAAGYRDLAALVAQAPLGTADEPPPVDEADARVEALRTRLSRLGHRPVGPATRYQALLALLDEAERADHLVGRIDQRAFHGPAEEAALALSQATSVTLHAAASLLEHDDSTDAPLPPPPDLVALQTAMEAHRDALVRWAITQRVPRSALDQRADEAFALRALAYNALAIGANVVITTGGRVDLSSLHTTVDTPATDPRAPLRRLRITLAAHLRSDSVWFRNSARAAVALAAATLVAGTVTGVSNFWVVLAVFSVLRSSITDTGATAARAVGGTTVGFVVAAALVHLTGAEPMVLWALLPFLAAAAAMAPVLSGVAASQACFAVTVVLLYNLTEPVGWTTALIRLESVALGAVVALCAAVLFWPRGARASLGTALAGLYHATAGALGAAARGELGPPASSVGGRPRRQVWLARAQVDAAFTDLVNERAGEHLDYVRWAPLLSTPTLARLTASVVTRLGVSGDHPGDPSAPPRSPTEAAVATHLDHTIAALGTIGDRLDTAVGHRHAWVRARPDALAEALVNAGASGQDQLVTPDGPGEPNLGEPNLGEPAAIRRELAEVWIAEWLGVLDHAIEGADAALGCVEAELARPWWR